MFCNFCGKKIAPEDRVCPYCGQAQESRSGGNGFWDILTNPSAADDADPEPVRTVREPVRPMREPAPPMPTPPVPTDRRRKRTSRGILILSIITVVLLLASIALDVLLFLNIVGINTKLETISEALTEVDGSTEALAPEATSPTSSETKAPTEPTSAPTTATTGEPSTAEGTSDPSATLGATGNDPAEEVSIIIEQPVDIKKGVAAGTEDAMFHIKYEAGEGRTVIWYHYQGSEVWEKIDDSSDEFKGKFKITNDDGYSRLEITSKDAGVHGRYKCEIRQGSELLETSKEVTFIFEQK